MTAYDAATGRIWRDTNLGAAVYVNGSHVEISIDYGVTVLPPDEAVTLANALVAAVAEAAAQAARWNTDTRTYDAEAAR